MKAIDQVYKDLIEAGWTMRDIDEADYHYLLHLYGESDQTDEVVDGTDFIKQFLSPTDLQILEERR